MECAHLAGDFHAVRWQREGAVQAPRWASRVAGCPRTSWNVDRRTRFHATLTRRLCLSVEVHGGARLGADFHSQSLSHQLLPGDRLGLRRDPEERVGLHPLPRGDVRETDGREVQHSVLRGNERDRSRQLTPVNEGAQRRDDWRSQRRRPGLRLSTDRPRDREERGDGHARGECRCAAACGVHRCWPGTEITFLDRARPSGIALRVLFRDQRVAVHNLLHRGGASRAAAVAHPNDIRKTTMVSGFSRC